MFRSKISRLVGHSPYACGGGSNIGLADAWRQLCPAYNEFVNATGHTYPLVLGFHKAIIP